jgi:hypothetical protein
VSVVDNSVFCWWTECKFCIRYCIAVTLVERQLFHSTFKLFTASLIFEFTHLVVMCAQYGQYSIDGVELYGVKTFGKYCAILLCVITIATDDTVTYG